MARILVVDDDRVSIDTLGRLLRLARYDVATAVSGGDAVRVATEFNPDVAVIDLNLPDGSGIDLLRELRARMPWTACIMVTGYGSCQAMIDAMRAGSCDWLNKPFFAEEALTAIRRALVGRIRSGGHSMCLPPAEPHAVTRLAHRVVTFVTSSEDVSSLHGFGRAVGVSPGCFRNWCRTAHVAPRSVLLFARALRAVWRSANESLGPENLLRIVDVRTLAKFLRASGGSDEHLPETVGHFLERQQFIRNSDAVDAIRLALEIHNAGLVEVRPSGTRRDNGSPSPSD
jgi:CheY-like chemotaxis protein